LDGNYRAGIRVSKKGLSPGRLEAFSDGIIAVIIYLMAIPAACYAASLVLIGIVALLWLLPLKADDHSE
jgi:hypothetical protein